MGVFFKNGVWQNKGQLLMECKQGNAHISVYDSALVSRDYNSAEVGAILKRIGDIAHAAKILNSKEN
ncbi:hypothetical protein AGMMS49975_22940 [Clostridia bacterium]|nr:hypothetical protein AGMMS49975_22940 [Clostridia bacterium]